ncbi:unnamed protein product [Boreogadus saida]
MAAAGLQILGIALGLIGVIGAIVTCAIPMWRVTAFIGQNIVTAQTTNEGIWMTCVVQSTGQMQCKVYDSMLALSQDLQAARAMVVISIFLGVIGTFLFVAGGKCTTCIAEERSKAKACIAAGLLFIAAGLLCLIPVSWSANTIVRNFYSPGVLNSQRRELGAALYIGWGAGVMMVLGGSLLCWNCPAKDEGPKYSPRYLPPQASSSSREYV